jgi:hypothetical protein
VANAWFRILGWPLDVVGEYIWMLAEMAWVELALSLAEMKASCVARDSRDKRVEGASSKCGM